MRCEPGWHASLSWHGDPIRQPAAQREYFRRVDPAYAEGVALAVARTHIPANSDPVSASQKPVAQAAE